MFKKLMIGAGVVVTGVVAYKNKAKLQKVGNKALKKVKEIKSLKKLLPNKKVEA